MKWQKKNLRTLIQTDLMSPLYHSNAKVCFDNFYTSFSLLQELYSKSIFAWGTVCANQKGLPKDLLPKTQTKLPKHTFKVAQKEKKLYVIWKDTKNVCFLSNFHSPQAMGVVNRMGADKTRSQVNVPKIIEDYQKHMKGVDLCDQNVSYYLPAHKTVKWWRRLFFYLTQVSIVNSYVYAKASSPLVLQKYPTQLIYIEAVAGGLIGKYRNDNLPTPHYELNVHPNALHQVDKIFE